MNIPRLIPSLVGSIALTASAALASPPNVPMPMPRPAAPPIGVPHPNVPPVSVPVRAGTNASTTVRARATIPTHATLTAINGNAVTVRLADGTMQTFNVSSDTAADLRASINRPIEFRVVNGMLTVMGHEGMQVLHGVVTSLNANTVTIRFRDGSTQTINTSAQTSAQLRALMNRPVAFRVNNGLFAFAGAQGSGGPMHGTLTAVSGTTATVRLVNGTTQTFTVSADDDTFLSTRVNRPVEFFLNADGSIRFNRGHHRHGRR